MEGIDSPTTILGASGHVRECPIFQIVRNLPSESLESLVNTF